MTSSRLLCVSLAKAAGETLARAGWSVRLGRRVCSSPSRLQSCMSAWFVGQYGTNEVLRYSEEIPMPTVRSPTEVMVKVHATSLNPLDVAMRGKCWPGHCGEHNQTLKFEILKHLLNVSVFRWVWSKTAEIKTRSDVSDGQRVPSDSGSWCVWRSGRLWIRGHPFCSRRRGRKMDRTPLDKPPWMYLKLYLRCCGVVCHLKNQLRKKKPNWWDYQTQMAFCGESNK